METIIKNSATLNEEVFRVNVATLLPSFKMTRKGIFHGIRVSRKDIDDPKGVIRSCWKQLGSKLLELRRYLDENTSRSRNRILADLSPTSKDYVIEKTSELFVGLREVKAETWKVGRVGASKILFAAFPEIALPVDNREWDHVFKTEEYQGVLSTMASEIDEWERRSKMPLDDVDPKQTLPSIYNVMAMAARRLWNSS